MYVEGKYAALKEFGLEKIARGWGSLLMDAGSAVRNMAVGEPGALSAYGKQLMRGSLFSSPPVNKHGIPNPYKAGLLHNPFVWLIPKIDSRDPFGSAMSFVNPSFAAYSGYKALTAPAEHRGEAIGRVAGNLVGTSLGNPLGMAGQLAGDAIGTGIGSAVGKQFDPNTNT